MSGLQQRTKGRDEALAGASAVMAILVRTADGQVTASANCGNCANLENAHGMGVGSGS